MRIVARAVAHVVVRILARVVAVAGVARVCAVCVCHGRDLSLCCLFLSRERSESVLFLFVTGGI